MDLRYATANNFVGAKVDGYGAARCLLSEPAARALAAVQADLAAGGLGLVVFDCYRPQRAVDHFVRWSREPEDPASAARHHPRVPKHALFEAGYIAARSGHSRGSTVDVTLARSCGEHVVPLDMGSAFDFFDPRSHYSSDQVTSEQRENRRQLRALMERHGFRGFEPEWWHFTLNDEPYPDRYFDVPIE